MGTTTIGLDAYGKYPTLSLLAYNCISYLMTQDEDIWKLLYYDTPDAWNRGALTTVQKASLIFKGEGNEANFRVFMDVGQPDAWVNEATVIRIAPYDIIPENRTVGTVAMMFEAYSHYKINHLTNYKTRVDWICQIFLDVFNGALVGGVGRLHFNRLGTYESKLMTAGQSPFKGKWIIMGVKSG